MVCLDNSEWMRNGDYAPTRLAAMQDAVNMPVRATKFRAQTAACKMCSTG